VIRFGLAYTTSDRLRLGLGLRVRQANEMVGILVHGNNHFILSGAEPTEAEAIAIARHFSLVKIGEPVSNAFEKWEIRNKEFRENLEWAVVVPGDAEVSRSVSQLLGELAQRGVIIRACGEGCW
jgi:hypothetical protein